MKKKFVCPWWMGYLLANPVRRLIHNPDEILSSYVKDGARILEVGPGMGFFTLPMARLSGENGRVFAVDLQQKMLAALKKRGEKAGLSGRIETRLSSPASLEIRDLAGSIDFALLFAVLHEVPDRLFMLMEVYDALRPGGTMLLSEPAGHVSSGEFLETVKDAENAGFVLLEEPEINMEYSALLLR